MNELYDIIAIFATGGIFLTLGLLLMFVSVPRTPTLGNYRKARRLMAFACLSFVPLLVAEYLFRNDAGFDEPMNQAITLIIAAMQALLFTLTLCALISERFPGNRYILRFSSTAIAFIGAVFAVYVFFHEYFSVAFYLFAGIYALMLIHYTLVFLARFRLFRLRVENYYSDDEALRARWVVFSFFAALAVGFMALLTAVIISTGVALFFSVVMNVFYLYFAIRFINYPQQFQTIDAAFYGEQTTVENGEQTAVGNAPVMISPAVFAVLEKEIEQWVAAGGFTQKGITIKALAHSFNTNGKYLSIYINRSKEQTFSEWINGLRIEKAKTMLLQFPEMNIGDISDKAGFADKSNFHRHFVSQTHCTPREWRNRHTK